MLKEPPISVGNFRFLFKHLIFQLSVFYGLKMDHGTEEHPSITENKVREIIHKKLQLTRDIPILRVKRVYNGPQVRGSKPVTVYFEKWQDKVTAEKDIQADVKRRLNKEAFSAQKTISQELNRESS